jgi:nitrous oxidase accessory protein NosD
MNRELAIQVTTFIAIFLFIFTVFPSPVYSVPPITQETLIVDINGDGDYISIQDAINNAKTTDIIMIKEGIYEENNLEINKKITIVGENPSNTIIDFSEKKGFILSSKHVSISNLRLINAEEYTIFITPESDSCTISNCIIEKCAAGIGIWIRASSAIVSDCIISGYNSTATGIKIRESNNIIKGCTLQGLATGIMALLNAHDNKIQNCNLINNEVAVDIRINSYNNIVSECNVYSNRKGVNIWQSSDNNFAYLNNFWKTDVDAVDEGNNTWDNGVQGNYWEGYVGQDINDDGIGDTPYAISEENKDRFPLIIMILPDVLTLPSNIRHVSSKSDNTPSFSWSPSVYNKEIKGYYVKIDSKPEIFIDDITSWTSPDIVSEGVHAFYVRAESTDDTSSGYAIITFSIDISLTDVDNDGWSDEEEQEYGTDSNDPDNYPLDTDGDFIPNSIDIDDDNDGYSDDMENSYRTNTADQYDYPTDTDTDGIPDDDSYDGKYVGDVDDDNDVLTDVEETKLGSNPKNKLDVTNVYLKGKPYYLIDMSQNGIFDVLYNPARETTTAVESEGENYLMDYDGNGIWDYTYNSIDGSVSSLKEEILPLYMWIILVLALLATVAFIILYLIKNKPTYQKHIRYPSKNKPTYQRHIRRLRYIRPEKHKKPIKLQTANKPPSRISNIDKNYTIEMMNETRILLQNIQQDFAEYVEKLRLMDEQIEETSAEIDEEEVPLQTKPSETQNIQQDFAEYVEKLRLMDEQIEETSAEIDEEEVPLQTKPSEKQNNQDTNAEVDKFLSGKDVDKFLCGEEVDKFLSRIKKKKEQ